MLREKIVVSFFLMSTTVKRVGNMGIMSSLCLVSGMLSVSNIESMSCFLLVSSFIQGELGESRMV